MSTSELAAEFPQVRDALEDLLNDAQYLQAIVHTLPQAQQITQAQAELGSANEALAQRNVALQEPLMRVRQETQAALDEARALEARWRMLELLEESSERRVQKTRKEWRTSPGLNMRP
ncbi:hypothetical protein EXIGLDRAFT_751715 [Exidia glandulosa HHB12029]|uniref:VPS37 C-terminal domain-containing protein n=1 Tax=Exidia glandulosa HHB12029 TaxID=1314781 RepID=A0A165F4S8_EXIGL|nr:hypothetical protein EXIGLDRAFT_751715 [Exidia glandulosa HHB12029]